MALPSGETKPLIYIVRQDYIDPDTVEVTILGARFGATQGTGSVDITPKIYSDTPTVISWSDSKIVVTVDFIESEVRDTTEQGIVQVITGGGQKVVQSNKAADLYGKKSNPPYLLVSSELVDDTLSFNGSSMDSVEAVVLVEDTTGDEFVAVELNKTPSAYQVRLPESATGFESAYLVSRNGTSVENKLAETIDINTTGPGYVWELAPQFTGTKTGKGIVVSNIPSGITHVKVTGSSSDVVFKPVLAYNTLNNRNLSAQAYYTDPAHTEILVRWNECVLNETIEATEPWVQVELLDYVNAPIVLTPPGGVSWEFEPTITNVTDNGDGTWSIIGTQLTGIYALGGGSRSDGLGGFVNWEPQVPITGFNYDRFTGPETILKSDTEIRIDKSYFSRINRPLPVTFDSCRASQMQAKPGVFTPASEAFTCASILGSFTINP